MSDVYWLRFPFDSQRGDSVPPDKDPCEPGQFTSGYRCEPVSQPAPPFGEMLPLPQVDRPIVKLYRPTDDELRLIRERYQCDPARPPWGKVAADLVASGAARGATAGLSAPEIVAMLGTSRGRRASTRDADRDWLTDAAERVHRLVQDEAARDRFRAVLHQWRRVDVERIRRETDRAAKAGGPRDCDGEGLKLYHPAMTLAEKYASLAAIHDELCRGEPLSPWAGENKDGAQLKEALPLKVLRSLVEKLKDNDSERIGRILADVERDLAPGGRLYPRAFYKRQNVTDDMIDNAVSRGELLREQRPGKRRYDFDFNSARQLWPWIREPESAE